MIIETINIKKVDSVINTFMLVPGVGFLRFII
jgi:hypothetical protein